MNGAYGSGWYDAAAVMMRRLLEIAIIDAFEAKKLTSKIKDKDDNFLFLSDLIACAIGEPALALSRNTKKYLPQLRDLGHQSAHGRYFVAHQDDLDKLQPKFRVVLEEFLRIAGLI
jgi:hypothetical protein